MVKFKSPFSYQYHTEFQDKEKERRQTSTTPTDAIKIYHQLLFNFYWCGGAWSGPKVDFASIMEISIQAIIKN